jgi:DNA-binding IclR family transcriptional regulator
MRAGEPAVSGGVQSIDRAVALLSVFTPERPVAGLSDIARLTGLSRSTAHRLLTALGAHGMVQQAPHSTAYSLGPRVLGLADTARRHLTRDRQAEPVMTWLRDQCGETVGLHVLDETPARRTLAQVESTQPLRRTYTDLGSPHPAHQGAPGKVLLAFAPEALRQTALARRLTTPDGRVLRADVFRAELEQIRADGYAISLQERVVGVVALAVPARDHTGQVTTALSISIPAVRAGRDELVALAPLALQAARTLSARLGYGLGPLHPDDALRTPAARPPSGTSSSTAPSAPDPGGPVP